MSVVQGKKKGKDMYLLAKKVSLFALGAAITLPLIVTDPISANAGPRRDAFIGGVVGGVVGGVIGSGRRARRGPGVVYIERGPRYRSAGRAHVNWCLRRYRSYNARTDTYISYGGRERFCNSPYN